MDKLTELLEKLRISLTSEEISNSDGRHPPDVLVRSLVDTLKENGRFKLLYVFIEGNDSFRCEFGIYVAWLSNYFRLTS